MTNVGNVNLATSATGSGAAGPSGASGAAMAMTSVSLVEPAMHVATAEATTSIATRSDESGLGFAVLGFLVRIVSIQGRAHSGLTSRTYIRRPMRFWLLSWVTACWA